MKLFNKIKPKPSSVPAEATGTGNSICKLMEKLKGAVTTNTQNKMLSNLGEEHPFDYEHIEKLMFKYGVVDAIVNKHVDFILSSGINIASEDERSKQIIEQWMKDVNFRTNIRPWIKEAISKGVGFMEIGLRNGTIDEIKTLNTNYMYKKRDRVGLIEEYNLYLKPMMPFGYQGNEIDNFKPNEIAELNINRCRDLPYGNGIVYPLLRIIDDLICSRSEMHKLMKRKANSPLIFKGGDKSQKLFPSASDTKEMKQKLQNLKNDHEWAISSLWEPTTIDFGNIGDKFNFIIENDIEILYMAAEIPAFLMGKASIAEGLAKEQMKGFMYKIQSMREEIEKVIEEKIFKRILEANGLSTDVEIIWGLPSEEEKNERIKLMNEIVKNPFTSPTMRDKLEQQIAINLGLDPEQLESDEEERRKEEEEEKQPTVPTGRSKKPSQSPPKNDNQEEESVCGCGHVHEAVDTSPGNCGLGYTPKELEAVRGLTVQEWVGFNYDKYTQNILDFLKLYNFEFLRGRTRTEFRAGLLTSAEIDKLRTTMMETFDENLTIKELEERIKKRIDIRDKYKMRNGKIVTDKNGNPIVTAYANLRPNMIARTETVRSANQGALKNYAEGGINKVRWTAAMSDRTCPECAGLNGQIFERKQSLIPPLHPNCRCTLSPVVE